MQLLTNSFGLEIARHRFANELHLVNGSLEKLKGGATHVHQPYFRSTNRWLIHTSSYDTELQ